MVMWGDGSLVRLLDRLQAEEIYNLGAQSHVRVSFDNPEYTSDVNATGCVRLLEAIRESGVKSRFYQASLSEMYGGSGKFSKRKKRPFIRAARTRLPRRLLTG